MSMQSDVVHLIWLFFIIAEERQFGRADGGRMEEWVRNYEKGEATIFDFKVNLD